MISASVVENAHAVWRLDKQHRLARVRGGAIKLLAGVLVLLMVASMGKLAVGGGAVPVFVMALNHVQQIGAWGVPLLIACEAIAFVLLVPISPLHVGMGFIYGPARGLLLAWFAYTIGCVPPFLLVRIPYLAERFTHVRRRMAVLDGVFSAVELEPFKLIVCLRLSPLLPSPLNSYLLGLTNVALRTYVLASLVGALFLFNFVAYALLYTHSWLRLLHTLVSIWTGAGLGVPLALFLLRAAQAAGVPLDAPTTTLLVWNLAVPGVLLAQWAPTRRRFQRTRIAYADSLAVRSRRAEHLHALGSQTTLRRA
jgi:uncharacterized membrane protein YdjX (TVP38/TMEM64 family)